MRVPTFLGEGDRYKIESEIGRGGMGSVYCAQDKNTGKRVAIKIMIDGANPGAQELFDKESRILAELQHPNIIGITDKGDFREGSIRYPFFVMPFLKGQTLHERIHSQEDPLTVERTIAIISTVANSLQAAHERSVVHRDIKPTNIFVLESGPVVVIDFGVVHLAENSASTTVKGTTLYMAPELLVPSKNENPSAASDLFSLGVVCYEALTGKHPFAKANDRESTQAILHEIPTPAFELNQNLSLVLSQVIQKAMAKDFRHRYSSVKEFADKLERAFRGESLPEFDRQVIENKLRVVGEALSRGQVASADELMRSIEEDGFIDPAISNQRQKIDQALRHKWVHEQLDNAKLYRDANQDVAALEKLNELLRKAPGNANAIQERDSILEERHKKLLNEARSLMARRLFAEARVAVQDATAIKPYDTQTTQLLDELNQVEMTDREFAERKAVLYKEAQKAQRDGHPGTALRHLEQLMEMIRRSSTSNPERDPIYKSFYDVVLEENNRLEKASQTVRICLSAGKVSEAISLCEQMLATNPGHSAFEALKLEAESQDQQTRLDYVNRIREDAEMVQDLDARVKMLQEAVERFPNESHLTGLLKSAKSKRDLVAGLLARARSAEAPGQYFMALELWQEVRKCHASYPGVDEEIQRVEKLYEMEHREDRRVRLVQEVVKLLRTGEYEKAAERSDSALSEFPVDDELLAYHVEAKERALLAPEVQSLIAEGRKLLQENSTDAAAEVLRRAARLDRNNHQVRQLLGVVVLDKAKTAMGNGFLGDASRLFNEAQTLIPDHPDVKSGIAQIRSQNKTETVEDCLSAVLRLSEAGDLNGALAKIDRSLKTYPKESRLIAESFRLRRLLHESFPAEATVLDRDRDAYLSRLDTRLPGPARNDKPEEKQSKPEVASTPIVSRFYDAVALHFSDLKDRAVVSITSLTSAAREKWEETGSRQKQIFGVLLLAGLVVLGIGGYRVFKGPATKAPAVANLTVPLDITTLPEGAEISVDGQAAVVSRFHQELKPGNHEVVVSLAGYESAKAEISLGSTPLNRVVTLMPLPMELRIVTPANSKGKVRLDNEAKGDLAGVDGLVIPGISAGTHHLMILPDGREPINAAIDLQPGHPPKLSSKPANEKAIYLFIGSFGGKLWAECNCPSGATLKLGDVTKPIDPGGVEVDQPQGVQPLAFSAPGVKENTLSLGRSANPIATIALYNWAAALASKESPADRVDRLYKQALDFHDKNEFPKALSLVRQALPEANEVQKQQLQVLEKRIERDMRESLPQK